MKQNGMYYITDELKEVIRSVGGEWNDRKKRPVVCLVPSVENDEIYWAIPVGKVNHRDEAGMNRIYDFMEKDRKDLRSCYYHLGRTSNKSIFFITDSIPVTKKYILEEHHGADLKHYIIKNKKLISTLQYKLWRILSFEKNKPNYFRQHITDVKNYLLEELQSQEENTKKQIQESEQ